MSPDAVSRRLNTAPGGYATELSHRQHELRIEEATVCRESAKTRYVEIQLEITRLRLGARGGADGGDGFVEGSEDVGGTRGGDDAMAVHVGAEVTGDSGEDDSDIFGCEIGEQVSDGACGGEVEVGDGAGVDRGSDESG